MKKPIEIKEYTTLSNLVNTILDSFEEYTVSDPREIILNIVNKDKFRKDIISNPGFFTPNLLSDNTKEIYLGPLFSKVELL